VSAEAAELRRALGPVAWIVLEELVLAGRVRSPGRVVAELDLRRIAARLELAKGTAARAMQRLQDCGVVRFEGSRQSGGRFGRGRYTVELNGTGVTPVVVRPPRVTERDTARRDAGEPRRRSHATEQSARRQLDLFDLEETNNALDDAPTLDDHEHATRDRDRHSQLPDPAAMSIDTLAPGVRARINRPAGGGH
jgi:hypothetical protein